MVLVRDNRAMAKKLRRKLYSILYPISRKTPKWLRRLYRNGYYLYTMLRKRQLRSSEFRYQTLMCFDSQIELSSEPTKLRRLLSNSGISFKEGRHSLYIYNKEDIKKLNTELAKAYPQNAGLKILYSTDISGDGTVFYSSRRNNYRLTLSAKAVGSIREKMIISNILSLSNMAPKVYDAVNLQYKDVLLQAMVVEYIRGKSVYGEEATRFMKKFHKKLRDESIEILTGRTVTKDGFVRRDIDLMPPFFNNNIIANEKAAFYVDIQNFVLNEKRFFSHLLPQMTQETHFGGSGPFRGKRYNYQSVPFMGTKGKRDTKKRFELFLRAFHENNIDIEGFSVLDVGSNLGVFIHYFLSGGAFWCTGIDYPEIIEVSKRFLYFCGCSRFDLIGCDLSKDDVLSLLPEKSYDIVLFLAMSHHIGFPEWMDRIKFEHLLLLYEGQALENISDAKAQLLKRFPHAEIIFDGEFQDGDSDYRPFLILKMV